jgi:N-acetylmuramoyl-L-alanine amidase
MKCVLVIGHKASAPGGYCGGIGGKVSEFGFNDKLASLIQKHSDVKAEINIVRIDNIPGGRFKALPDEVNRLNPDFVISLHCGNYNGTVSGSETFYHRLSKPGEHIADILQSNFVAVLGLLDRGVKPVELRERHAFLLTKVEAPCVVAVPFFIDNKSDCDVVGMGDDTKLLSCYVKAINEIVIYLSNTKK